jgi:hypothetical protein
VGLKFQLRVVLPSEWVALPSGADGVNVPAASAAIVKYSIKTEVGLSAGQ